MELDAKLEGFKEFAAGLRELPGNVGKNVLRRAVSAGASVVRVEAKNNALAIKETGTLARSIYQKQIRELSGPRNQVFYVGARSGKQYRKVGKKGVSQDAYYARWVELGHFTRGPGKGGFFSTGSGRLFRETNRGQRNNAILAAQVHAGVVRWVPAHPFLRPAYDVKVNAAVDAMGASIGLSLLTEAQRSGMTGGQ